MSKALSLIIPTYNEVANVNPLVEKIHSVLTGYDYEIIFIDDDSEDGTAEAVAELGEKFPVRVVVRKDKKGLASAVVDGIGYAAGDVVGVMDADLQHPPEVIPDLLRALENGAEVVVASRYVKGGGCVGWGLVRRIISRGAVLIAHLFLPGIKTVHDPMSGFAIFKRQVVEGVALTPTGYKILLEILVKGHYQQLVEVPYWFRSRQEGKSKLNIKQQLYYLQHIYALTGRWRELLRFGKFCLVGGSGVLVNMGLLFILTEFAGLYYLLSAVISIEAAIISNFILNDLFTFSDRRSPGLKGFLKRMLRFNLVSLAGLVINMAVLWLLTGVVGVHYLYANIWGIALATFWNYLANLLWTWR